MKTLITPMKAEFNDQLNRFKSKYVRRVDLQSVEMEVKRVATETKEKLDRQLEMVLDAQSGTQKMLQDYVLNRDYQEQLHAS